MKKIAILLLCAVLIITVFSSCSSKKLEAGSGDKLKIVTTIFPPYDFARAVAGDHADITMLVKPGNESHYYEPSLADIALINDCDLFIYSGTELDKWVENVLSALEGSKIQVIAMSDVVTLVEESMLPGMESKEHDHPEHEGANEPEYDEHVWTSIPNAMKIMSKISDKLCEIDPESADYFKNNAKEYNDKLASLDNTIRETVDSANKKTIVFAERFPFRYFADEYGLICYAAFSGCSSETEPSLATVGFLTDCIKNNNIKYVFTLEFSDQKTADVLCRETGAEKLTLHSCHNVSKSDFENGVTYFELMQQNANNLKEALR